MESALSFVAGLLTAALSLLGLVEKHPELPQESREQAQQVAEQAITQATQALSTGHVPTSKNVQVGDKVGDIVVADIRNITLSGRDAGKRITFSGETTITGRYTVGGFSGSDSISISIARADNPRFAPFILDAKAQRITITFNNAAAVRQALAGNAGNAAVVIGDLSVAQTVDIGGASTADLISVKNSAVDTTLSPGREAMPCVVLTRTLTVGSTDATTGGEVSKLQTFLMGQGTLNDPVYPERVVNGYFDEATSRAVQEWQRRHGISITTVGRAVVGPKTRAAMAAKCQSLPSQENTSYSPSIPVAVAEYANVKSLRWEVSDSSVSTAATDIRIILNVATSDGKTKQYVVGKLRGIWNCEIDRSKIDEDTPQRKMPGDVKCFGSGASWAYTVIDTGAAYIVESKGHST